MRATTAKAALVARRAIAVLVAGAMTIPIAVGVSAGVASAAGGVTYNVVATSDGTGACTPIVTLTSNCPTFRAAVAAANANAPSTIVLPAGTYSLTSAGPTITGAGTTISGAGAIPGPTASTIDGSGLYRALTIAAANVTIKNVVIAHGGPSSGNGGGILVNSGGLTFLKSSIVNSKAVSGGGLAVASGASAIVRQSTIANNLALNKGGGLYSAGTLTVENSTVDTNTGTGGGGVASSGTTNVNAATIYNNLSLGDDGGGIYRVGGSFTIAGSIVADNLSTTDDRDCYGSSIIWSGKNDVAWTHGCTPSSVLTADPKLGGLSDNGGGTLTRLPLPGSPVINAYAAPCVTSVDQRGLARPQGGGCELGSVEVAPLSVSLQLTNDANQSDVPTGAGSVPLINLPDGVFVPPTTTGGAQNTPAKIFDISTAPAKLFPAKIFPAKLFPAKIFPAKIFPAKLFPAKIFPAKLFPAKLFDLVSLADLPINLDPCPVGWVPTSGGALCGGWPQVLQTLDASPPGGTSLALQPLQGVHLSDIYNYPQIQALTVGQLDLSNTPLGSLPVSAFLLDGLDISQIPLNATLLGTGPAADQARVQAWCTALGGTVCADIHIVASDPTSYVNVTTLVLAYAGVSLDGVPLGSVKLSWINLNQTNMGADLIANLAISALAPPIGVSSLGLTSLVDCTNATVNCSPVLTNTETLGSAWSKGAIRSAATVATAMTSLLDPNDLPTQGINLTGGPIPNLASPLQPAFTYTGTATLGGNVATTFTFDLTLPSGFLVANAPGDPAPVFVDASPLPACSGPAVSCWSFTNGHVLVSLSSVNVGIHTITVKARAGLQTGSQLASATVMAKSGADTQTDTETSTVNVLDAFELTNAGYVNVAPGSLYVAHITSTTDVGLYKFVVPTPSTSTSLINASIELSNLAADYDLVMYGPPRVPLRGAPVLHITPVNGDNVSINPLTDASAPDVVGDVKLTPNSLPDGLPHGVVAVSAHRGTSDEHIDTVALTPGATYWIQVTGYNGANSSFPYTLQVRLPSTDLPACPAWTYTPVYSPSGVPNPASGYPAGLDTLYLIAPHHMDAITGGASTTIGTALANVTGAVGGTIGGVLPIDESSAVKTAWDAWDVNRCSPDLANNVVREVGKLIDAVRSAHPTLRYIVLVGDDGVLPMARLADTTTLGNERGYASSFSGNNQLVGSLAASYFLSDDPYGTKAGIDLTGRELFVPELAVGRLVGTPNDIANALNKFHDTGGVLDASTAHAGSAVVTGYDFFTDGSQTAAANLTANGLITDSSFISDIWTANGLRNKLFTGSAPGVLALNAHYDQANAVSAADNKAGTITDLFNVSDLGGANASKLSGRVIFTIGCHAGLSESDVVIGSTFNTWAKAYASQGSLFVANTGYGYGDDAGVTLSELLSADFAQQFRSDGSVSVGTAFARALRQYYASLGVVGSNDEKVMQQVVFYGLPMYRTPGTGSNSGPATINPTFTVDPSTGLSVATTTITPTFNLNNTASGDYYDVNGSTINVQNRPVEPLVLQNATVAGKDARGVLITGLITSDFSPGTFTPHFDRPVLDTASKESLLTGIGDAAFPASFGRVATAFEPDGSFSQTLALTGGQFRPTGPGVGTQRLFNSITTSVMYANIGQFTDIVAPQILTSSADVATAGSPGALNSIHFAVTTDGSPGSSAKRVLVLYRGNNDLSGVWKSIDLTNTSGTPNWNGIAPTSSTLVEYFVQAVGPSGLVGLSDNKVTNFLAFTIPPTGPVSIGVTPVGGPQPTNGWFSSAANTTITCTNCGDITYSLDGAPFVPYIGPFNVVGDGAHIVQAAASNGSFTEVSVPIDTTNPTVGATTNPALPLSGFYGPTVPVTVTISATDPGGPAASGVRALVYAVAPDPAPTCSASSPASASSVEVKVSVTTTLNFCAIDNAGNVSAPGSITIKVDTTAPTPTLTAPTGGTNLGSVELNSALSVSTVGSPTAFAYGCTDNSGGSGIAATNGCVVTVQGPAPATAATTVTGSLPTDKMGEYTVTVTATDNVGLHDTASLDYVVVDTTPPSVTLTAPLIVDTTHVEYGVTALGIGAGPSTDTTYGYSCSDSGSGVASCVASLTDPTIAHAVTSPVDGALPNNIEGDWTVTVTAMDQGKPTANVASTSLQYHVLDSIAPVVTFTNSNLADEKKVEYGSALIAARDANPGSGAAILFSCADTPGTGVKSCDVKATPPGGVAAALIGGVLPTDHLGVWTVTVTSVDNAASANQTIATYNYTVIDTGPPVITIAASGGVVPATVEEGSVLTLYRPSGSGAAIVFDCQDPQSGVQSCMATVTGHSGSLSSGDVLPTGALGDFTITVNAVDKAGNPSSMTFTYTVVDTTKPGVTLVPSTTNYPSVSFGSHFAIGQSPATADVVYSCADNPGGSGIASCNVTITDSTNVTSPISDGYLPTNAFGTFIVTVTATDNAGNSSAKQFTYTVVDNTPPSALITPPASTKYHVNAKVYAVKIPWGSTGSTSKFNYSCADFESGLRSCVLTVTAPNSTKAVVVTGTLPTSAVGTYKLTLTAIDNSGNPTVVYSSYTVVYKICIEYSSTTATSWRGSTTLKIEVCDDNDRNMSDSTHLEIAVRVDGTLIPSTNVQGTKNYGYQFFYNSSTKMYVYTLNTGSITGITTGRHGLTFAVDGVVDIDYGAPFSLK